MAARQNDQADDFRCNIFFLVKAKSLTLKHTLFLLYSTITYYVTFKIIDLCRTNFHYICFCTEDTMYYPEKKLYRIPYKLDTV